MADHPDAGAPKSVSIDGDVVGTLFAVFSDADDLVEQLKRRAAYIGIAYAVIEDVAALAEGSCSKYLRPAPVAKRLTIQSLTKIAAALGLKAILVVDEELTRRNRRHWGGREAGKAHNTGRQRRRAIAAEAIEHEPAPAPP